MNWGNKKTAKVIWNIVTIFVAISMIILLAAPYF